MNGVRSNPIVPVHARRKVLLELRACGDHAVSWLASAFAPARRKMINPAVGLPLSRITLS